MSESIRRGGALRDGVAEELRVLLVRRRIRATDLARRLGWSQSYISRRMVGDQPFDVDDLEALARELDVNVIDLLPASARATREYPGAEPRPVVPGTVAEPPGSRRPRSRVDQRRPGGAPPPTRGRTAPTGQ